MTEHVGFDNLQSTNDMLSIDVIPHQDGRLSMAESTTPAVPDAEIEDVARLLGVSPRTAYRIAERNEIPSYRVGGRMRFDLAEVAAAVRATRTPA
jgi:excisionase family DNA binding protein